MTMDYEYLNISRDQFSVQPLLNTFLYLIILALSLTLKLGALRLVSIFFTKQNNWH